MKYPSQYTSSLLLLIGISIPPLPSPPNCVCLFPFISTLLMLARSFGPAVTAACGRQQTGLSGYRVLLRGTRNLEDRARQVSFGGRKGAECGWECKCVGREFHDDKNELVHFLASNHSVLRNRSCTGQMKWHCISRGITQTLPVFKQ